MTIRKTIRTTLLTDEETLDHRLVVAQAGGRWACECCGFVEAGVIAWTSVQGQDVRLSCLECHPYEDPWRYEQDVAIAWMPLHSTATISHIVRLLALTGKIDIAEWAVKEAEKSQDSGAALKVLFEAVRDADAAQYHKETTDIGQRFTAAADRAATEATALLTVALRKSISNALSTAAADISKGISAAEEGFKGMAVADVIIALEVGPEGDRDLMKSGIRFIPKTFSSSRIGGWDDQVRSLKDMFLSELVEVAKLDRKHKLPAIEPETSKAAADTAAGVAQSDTAGPDAPSEHEGRSLRSLLSIFRLTGGKS